MPQTYQNPVVVTPATATPVVGQGPVTQSAPVNLAIGGVAAGAAHAGAAMLTGDPLANAMALFLNLIAQPIKKLKWFPEKEGLIVLFIVVSFLIGWFFLYHGDAARTFTTTAVSTMLAKVGYKADKASGLNILEPTSAEQEFGT